MIGRPHRRSASLGAVLITAAVACTYGRSVPSASVDPAPAFDQARATRLQQALEDALAQTGTPGAQAAVVAADGSVWTGAAGVADIERDRPMTSDLLMVPASISKVYTATLTLLLVQDGSLSLDDPVERWLTGTPYAEGVRIRHLLNHTSGIASDDPTLPPVCDPGTCQSYSNGGYNLLGRIVEEASGLSYAELLRQRISGPLGLEATFVPLEEPVVGESAIGYDTAGEGISALELEENRGTSDEVGSGGVMATAADVARFAHALFTGDVLGARMMAELLDFEATSGLPGSTECRATGAVIRESGDEGESWGHGGFAGSFVASVEHFARHDVTVAVIANSGVAPPTDALNTAALDGAVVVDEELGGGRSRYDIAVRSPEGSSRLVTDDARFETAPMDRGRRHPLEQDPWR